MADDLQAMHARLKEMLVKTPTKINSAGIETTRKFLEWHKKASRVASLANPSREKLTSIYNEALQQYK